MKKGKQKTYTLYMHTHIHRHKRAVFAWTHLHHSVSLDSLSLCLFSFGKLSNLAFLMLQNIVHNVLITQIPP